LLSETELDELVHRTVALYNRFHSPEAIAKIVTVTPYIVRISFTGSFCYSCGVLDYLEDFVHEFELFTDKVRLKIDKTHQVDPRTFEADYKVKYR
jgi:hypothetical protein